MGVWLLLLMPLLPFLEMTKLLEAVPPPQLPLLPTPPWIRLATVDSLAGAMLNDFWLSASIFFCAGSVLLFAKEKGRLPGRPGRLNWTRRWGVLACYLVLLLNFVGVMLICGLVTAGIAGLFMSMPLAYEPPVTGFLTAVSSTWLR